MNVYKNVASGVSRVSVKQINAQFITVFREDVNILSLTIFQDSL